MDQQIVLSFARWGLCRKTIGFLLVIGLLFGTVTLPEVWAATYYVNDDTGYDSRTAGEAQNPATPWKTISKAVGDFNVIPGDAISVAAGTYDTALGESFPLALRNGVAIEGEDPSTTTISAPGGSAVFANLDTPLASGTTLSGFTLTHDSSASGNVAMSFDVASAGMAPQIFDNAFVGVANNDLGINIVDSGTGARSFTGLIDGNSFTDLSKAVREYLSFGGASANLSPTIHANTFSGCGHPVWVELDHGFEGAASPVITDNQTTGSQTDIYMEYDIYDGSGATMAPLISGNTLTRAGSRGMELEIVNQESLTDSDVEVRDNVVDAAGTEGLAMASADFPSGTSYVALACNTVINSISHGVVQSWDSEAPPPDYGGGESEGFNTLMGSGGYDFYNWDDDAVAAQGNWWGTTDGSTIDTHIFDNEEDSGRGAVDFSGYLSGPPQVSATATLDDAVFADVGPPGPSLGDTIRYTAILEGTGDCSCASAVFRAPIPGNGTFIDDSLTASRGILINDEVSSLHPELIVGLGALEAGETVTIAWDVIAGPGCSMVSQGTLSCYQLGDVLTDDPDGGNSVEPTVTYLGGTIFCDGFESGDTSFWSDTAP